MTEAGKITGDPAPGFALITGGRLNTDRRRRLQRLLLYSHDSYGLGHLRRNLAIATHMLRTTDQLQVVLVTGSTVASRFPLPRGLSLVSLPPVVKVAPEEYAALDRQVSFGVLSRVRAAIIADVALRFEPDALLVDHAPQGMKGELLPTFKALSRHLPDTRIVLGLRDVLDDPATVRHTWKVQGVIETLERVYHRVLVYGSEELLDVATAYGIPSTVTLNYCGYVSRRDEPPAAPAGIDQVQMPDGPFVLGTAGGGEDGLALLRATLRATQTLGVECLLVTGPLMNRDVRAELNAEAAASGRARTVAFVTDLERVMARSTAIVTMGGYNTLCEAVASGVPTVVVPRTWPRREQEIRANLFAARGLVRVVDPGDDLAGRLTLPLRAAVAEGVKNANAIDLDGAKRVRTALLEEVARLGVTDLSQVDPAWVSA